MNTSSDSTILSGSRVFSSRGRKHMPGSRVEERVSFYWLTFVDRWWLDFWFSRLGWSKKGGWSNKARSHNITAPEVAPVNMAKFDELYLVRWPSWTGSVAVWQWWPWSDPLGAGSKLKDFLCTTRFTKWETYVSNLALHFFGRTHKKSFHRLMGVFVQRVVDRAVNRMSLCPIPADFMDVSGHPPRSWKSVTPIWRSSVERPGTWALKWAQLGYFCVIHVASWGCEPHSVAHQYPSLQPLGWNEATWLLTGSQRLSFSLDPRN